MNPLKLIDGYKTYISILAYAAYTIALRHSYIPPLPDVEILLKSAIGASLTNKIAKLTGQPESDPTKP